MRHEDLVAVMRLVPEGGNWRDLPADIVERVMGGAYESSGGRVGYFRRLDRNRPAPTILGSPSQKSTLLWHPFEDRPIDIHEAARLQSYPDITEHGEPMNITALDLFAGTGWGVACQWLGIEEHGVELMPEAVATREANGMSTIYNDVWEGLEGGDYVLDDYDLLIASPPCQTFSMAGGGAGRQALDEVVGLIDSGAYRDVAKLRAFGEEHDPRTALVLTPLTHVYRDLPRYVVLEQVPPVLPVWKRMAEEMREWGYSVWVGVLSSEQYGVPQTRKRAILIAKRDPELDGEAAPPTPTHSAYYSRDPQKLDEGVLPWVSMAEALGWGMTDEPMPTITAGTHGPPDRYASGGQSVRKRIDAKVGGDAWKTQQDQPSTTITSKPNEWMTSGTRPNAAIRKAGEPSVTLAFGNDAASYRFGVGEVGGDSYSTTKGAYQRVEAPEASALQSYPPAFNWAPEFNGKPLSKTKAMLQIGNAVPPLLARAVLEAVLGK